MKSPLSKFYAANLAPALKICGLLLILMTIINCGFVVFLPNLPPKPTSLDNLRSQVELVVQLVDQGFVALLGLILFSIGLWIDSTLEVSRSQRKFWRAIALVAFVLASLIGLLYLISAPLHLNNARLARQQTMERIGQDISTAEAQLNTQINTELQQQRARISTLLQADSSQLQQAITSGQVSAEQGALLKQFKENPQTLDQFLERQATELRNQAKGEIITRKETAENQARVDGIKTGLRVGISSILLAIAYAVLGWSGLKVVMSKDYLGERDYGIPEPMPSSPEL